MTHLLLIIAAVSTGVVGAHFFPTEEMLQDRFALGQQYYAANDHENSVQIFSEIEKTPNYALLNVDRIEVTIGELTLPIRVAATYQLGNSNRNVGRSLLERSRNAAVEGDSTIAAQRLQEALRAFSVGKIVYRQLISEHIQVPQHLRVMASYQIVRASYQMEDYAAVVGEAEEMIARFPDSEYQEAALYDAGWAHYYRDDYRAAIETYGRMLEISTDALKFDRALFQTGESFFALGEYETARTWYGKLVEKYDFSALSEKELQQMKTQRLRGLVQETTRELVAKAQIRIADSHAIERHIDEAIAAYSLVPRRYPQEDLLVQKSYDNMATMVLEEQGVMAGIAVLRQAIEQVADPHFRGRVQLKIAKTLYSEGEFALAIEEYGIYKKAYGDRAAVIGVSLDQVDFLIAEAHRELARVGESEQDFRRPRDLYLQLIATYPSSTRLPEAYYGLGHAQYRLGELPAAATAFAQAVIAAPQAPVAPHALSWQARLAFAQGENEQALELYQRVIDEYAASGLADQAWKDKALVYKVMGRLDEAIGAFGEVGRSSAMWSKIQAEAGDMLLAAGRLDDIAARFDIEGALTVASAEGDDETVAELYYIKGRSARERKEYQIEVAHLSAALDHSENEQLQAFAHFFRGLAYYQLGSAADASGDTLRGSGFFEASVEDLERLLDADAATQLRPVAYRTRGVVLTRLSRPAEAVRTYEILIEAAATAQERAEFELMLMELFYDQGQLGNTEAVARRLISQADAGQFSAERAYFVLVSLLLEQERYGETLAAADGAMEGYPNSTNRATLMSVRARCLFFLARYEEAATGFAQFITAYPKHPERPSAHYQQGYCHEFLGQFEQAAEAFAALVADFPADELAGDALYRRGENLYNASKFQEALETYVRVGEDYQQTPMASKALYSASWTYMDLGREEESIGTMERLIAEAPESDYARYAQFSIGDFYYSKRDFAQAQAAYRQVFQRYPGTTEAKKAQELIRDLNEDLASKAYDEVFVDFDRGNYTEAARGFERVYADFPGSYSALAALANKGVALEHLGNSDDARGTYARVLQLAADDPELSNIVEFVTLRLGNL